MKELESIEIPYLVRIVNGEETENISRVFAFIQEHLGIDNSLPPHCVIHIAGNAGVGKSTNLKDIINVALEEGLNPSLITYNIMCNLFLSNTTVIDRGILTAHFVEPHSRINPNYQQNILNTFKQAITGHSLVIVDEAVCFRFDKEGSILAELLRERYKNNSPIVVIFATNFCDYGTNEIYKVSPYLQEVLDNPSVIRKVITQTSEKSIQLGNVY